VGSRPALPVPVPAPLRVAARRGDDRGQATPLGAAILALALLVVAAIGPVGRALGARTQARTAADAAALAGAADGEDAADDLAGANGAELLRFTRDGDEVVVEVSVEGVRAWASARGTRLPPAPAGPRPGAGASGGGGRPGGGGDRAGLAPAMVEALGRVDALLGRTVTVASGLRTRAEQQALWDRRHVNPYPVARPGTSDHETGLAVDIPRAEVPDVLAVAGLTGLCQPLPESDPVHFVVCGT
jgi:hypothetical protein